jgi:DNA-binding SARP family transcriptional activator
MRIYLTGMVSVQQGARVVPERALPGPQARVVFVMLAAEHRTPLSRDQLAEEIWNGRPPLEWEVALRALISRRPLLAGANGPRVDGRRRWLLDVRVRALECLSEVWRRKGDSGQAARDAEMVLRLDPYRETAYRQLMLAHAASGNRAGALLAYERCRRLLAAELGTTPSPALQALHLELLRTP